MNHDTFPLEHVHSLLADKALMGADAAEEAGLRCLLQHYPELDADSFELTAAALDLALAQEYASEPLPASLLNRLEVQAAALSFVPLQNTQVKEPVQTAPPTRRPAARVNSSLTWAGWLVAACVFLFAVLPDSSRQLSLSQLRQRGALVVNGAPGPHGTPDLQGEFIWDDKTQQGYMKLRNFPVNNPSEAQLQLWIFDDRKFTEKTPVDGGVFDIASNKEVLIPIKASIRVGKPQLFAITVEEPGGVPVSERKKLIFVGPVKTNPN